MKTIGILGGTSSQATAEYYRLINQGINEELGGWNTGEIIINSVNFANIERMVRGNRWDELAEHLRGKAVALERAGADMLICVSNTLHRVAEAFTRELSIPFLHIADPTGAAIRNAGLARVGLLGTKPVMSADFLKRRYLVSFGIETMVPGSDEQSEIDRIIFDELVRGDMQPTSKATFLGAVENLRQGGAQGVILGCTEIFLLMNQADKPDLPMFDTTALHVEATVQAALR